MVNIDMPAEMLDNLDAWIAQQPKPVTRPEAVRTLVAAALRIMGPADDCPGGDRRD